MADPPQIHTGFRHSADDHLPGAFEISQRVDIGRTGQLSPAKMETGYRKETNDSCYCYVSATFRTDNHPSADFRLLATRRILIRF